jgi:hypothetical protein
MLKDKNKAIIVSYMTIRILIGAVGIILPFACVVGGILFRHTPAQPTISAYYHTNMRDYLVGSLFAVSVFLICYKGYEKIDNYVTNVIGAAGFGVAIFPCLAEKGSKLPVGIFQLPPDVSNAIHLCCAAVFFVLLAVNSIFIFTLRDPKKKSDKQFKRYRNAIYLSCGVVILACIALLGFFSVILYGRMGQTLIGIILETIMLIAFSVSWLVKGGTILKDRKEKLR